MDLKSAVGVAKQHVGDLFAADAPRDIRLENFLYDDHLGVWTLTLGFARADGARRQKIVRVSEANQSVLSIGDP